MDGTENQTDATLLSETTETPKTYTEEEYQRGVRHAKTAIMADAMRAKTVAEEALARVSKMVKDQEDAELEAARDEPDKLSVIRERQARRKAQSELQKVQQELDEKNERLRLIDAEKAESTKEQNAREIAARLNVDPVRLAKLAKFTDGTPEAIEDIAKELPKVSEGKPALKVDSGKGGGGGGVITAEWLATATTQELKAKEAEIDKAYKEGKIK